MSESESYPTDITETINNYEVPSICKFCNSVYITLHLDGKFIVCNTCGKHQLYGLRFHFLEETATEITINNIITANNEAQSLYSSENQAEGTYYYFIGLLLASL